MEQFSWVWLVIFLPLLGSLVQALTGKAFVDALGKGPGRLLMGVLAVAFPMAAFFVAAGITYSLGQLPPDQRSDIVVKVYDLVSLQTLSIPFELKVDPLSMTMALVVTGIGSLIHIFATAYMADEKDFPRFFTYLNLFVAFMLTLVLGNNLAMLFIGWEGVGVCSYLLIGFWYKDLNNSRAANKAFIVNRIGDVGLTLGMFFLVFLLATNRDLLGTDSPRWLSFDVILPAAQTIFTKYPAETTTICVLLFVGAMGKSAQFPLFVWLPDAMAGPTPVSALIHAATMVTAGVVLLNRMSPLFVLSPAAMTIVAVTGAVTALLGASIAFGQTDIKKVLAYSTVSQLGYMFIACGVGAFWAGMFHVITHAFFKALLFLGSGAVIHAMAHNQDMRNYGNLKKYMPITYAVMGIGWAAIAGIPFLFSGFWSKEAVLGKALNDTAYTLPLPFELPGVPTWGALAGWIGFVVAAMTAAYMTRMMVLTFGTKEERWRDLAPAHGHDRHGHDSHDSHGLHAAHAHAGAHGHDAHHGEDTRGYFFTEEEMKARAAAEEHEHHHSLDKNHTPHEVHPIMWLPLVLLAIGSLGPIGAMAYGDLFNHVSYPLQDWLFPGVEAAHGKTAAYGTPILITLSLITMTIGVGLGLATYWAKLPASQGWDWSKWNPVRRLAGNQWGIDWLFSNLLALQVSHSFGKVCKWIDENIVDGLVMGFGALSQVVGRLVRLPQTGRVREYALVMQIGVVCIIGYLAYLIIAGGVR